MNFKLSEKEKAIEEFLYVLKIVEKEVNKATINNVLVVDAKVFKAKGKGKGKMKGMSRSKAQKQ